jgi:2-polyprenyl-3-methyl-5-hydroxy-6-metoxy-1,4-benzoquinol methylase
MIRDTLKQNKKLVALYQKLIGYNAKGKHWCRVVMDQETDKLVDSLNIPSLDVLEISGDKWKPKGFKSYTSVQYPEFDICANAMDRQFDLIIAEQVFEHLLWPYQAGRNVHSMLMPGGHFLITTPFMIRVHNFPYDCSRWTATGLRYFLAECGFSLEQITVGSWGNEKCVVANFHDWMPYNKRKHSLHNEEDFPLVVWAIAKK